MRTAVAAGETPQGDAAKAIAAIAMPPPRPAVGCSHVAPADFRPGEVLPISLRVKAAKGAAEISATLFYRHVNQAERWRMTDMTPSDAGFRAAIARDYTASPFPLQYYFELSRGDTAWLYPAFDATLSNQPYYAVWKRRV
jgi:hypothetical protein